MTYRHAVDEPEIIERFRIMIGRFWCICLQVTPYAL